MRLLFICSNKVIKIDSITQWRLTYKNIEICCGNKVIHTIGYDSGKLAEMFFKKLSSDIQDDKLDRVYLDFNKNKLIK